MSNVHVFKAWKMSQTVGKVQTESFQEDIGEPSFVEDIAIAGCIITPWLRHG